MNRVIFQNGTQTKFNNLGFYKLILKKQGHVMILRLKNFTLDILNYNIFEVVTSWLDTVLSLFLHMVDDVFPDSSWKILAYSYFKVTPEIKIDVLKMRWLSWPFNIPNRKVRSPWNRWRTRDLLSSNPVVHVSNRSLRIMSWAVSYDYSVFLTRSWFVKSVLWTFKQWIVFRACKSYAISFRGNWLFGLKCWICSSVARSLKEWFVSLL